MKVFTLIAVFAASITVQADFHVLGQKGVIEDLSAGGGGVSEFERLIGCPSNIFNCDCFADLRGGTQSANGNDLGISFPGQPFPADNFFQLVPPSDGDGNFCGEGALNFFLKQGVTDGSWEFFKDGGVGTVLGTCFPQSPDAELQTCIRGLGVTVTAFDFLVCFSFLCQP